MSLRHLSTQVSPAISLISVKPVASARKSIFHSKTRCVNELCQSNGDDGACASSADCPTDHYCNAGACTKSKSVGDSCTSKYECGRTAFCFFN